MSVTKVKVEQKVTKINPIQTITKINLLNNVNTVIDDSLGYIRTTFIGTDTIKVIGVVPINKVINQTILEVTTAGTGTATIGTNASQGILMSASQNDLSVADMYVNVNNLLMNTTTMTATLEYLDDLYVSTVVSELNSVCKQINPKSVVFNMKATSPDADN